MNINNMTIGQLQQVAGLAKALAGGSAPECPCEKRKVVVRSYGAGVFYGTLVEQRDQMAVLENCRRIWNWQGAKTLSEVAMDGIASSSKVAKATARHQVFEVIEIIDTTPSAAKAIEAVPEFK